MGDSDDDYDRKRRDKFRGERERGAGGGERERWQDRSGGDRNRSRNDYYRPNRYSPPPMKRMRGGDFEDRGHPMGNRFGGMHDYGMYGGYGSAHDPYGALSPYGGGGGGPSPREHIPPPVSDGMFQPAMLTLKQFLATQDDSIADDVAITKYGEYKLEFKRGQMNEFFVSHKDEEWFKLKYHPELSIQRREEQIGYLKKRAEVFTELLTKGEIAKVTADTSNTDQLIRLLDTVVIKLEGGSDDDLKVLDEKPVVIPPPAPKVEEDKKEVDAPDADTKPAEEKKSEGKKRKRTHTDSSSNSESESESEAEETKAEKPTNGAGDDEEETKNVNDENVDEPKDENLDSEMKEIVEEDKPAVSESQEDEKKVEEVVDLVDEESPKKLEELHKTSSIFVRNLAPTVTKAEVEALCRRHEGFLRVAIADPAVERRWFRRGWITFKRDVNIKEICWNLNNIRIRDCELAPIVNRDLSRRVRPVNGITSHKTVCKNDIKLCAKIAHSLDEKSGLWKDIVDEIEDKKTFGLKSKNPVLKNITDYLIEEADAEEEELLGLSSEKKDDAEGELLERDPELVSVLDRIIFYLRIVHSVDFYNHCEYPYEDEMPNRCGIIHARGPRPQNKITSSDIQEYIKSFETKMAQFLAASAEVPEEELKKLGAKDIDAEVEKFISANSQELAKDKWLCPLSGKKFKGPDYIRKHIMSKHVEKVEEVKKEVEYFNNYLKDAKRPSLPENPGNAKKEGMNNSPMYRQPHFNAAPMPYQGYPYSGPMMRGRGGFSRGGGGGRMEMPHRPLIHYRDLDAPSGSVDDIF